MKISSEYIGRILASHFGMVQRANLEKPAPAAPKADRATFSGRAEEIDLAMQVISGLPEVRAEKVTELRDKMARGEFRVSAEEVANKILADAHLSKLLGE